MAWLIDYSGKWNASQITPLRIMELAELTIKKSGHHGYERSFQVNIS